jgi:biotin-dependent carboxylase-like uncharacterized protein
LEVTVAGPELEMLGDAHIALAGEIDCSVSGPWPRAVRTGDRVKLGTVRKGVRAYLAIDGGFAQPSRYSTVRIRAGDVAGRAERAGGHMRVPPPRDGRKSDPIEVRAIPGPHLDWFTPRGVETFFSAGYTVSSRSDRRGLRMEGPRIDASRPADLPPEGVPPGAVQVPGDGLPIALGPDGPVTGGYARIACVISADLPLLAQARPGQKIRFVKATLQDALAAGRRS